MTSLKLIPWLFGSESGGIVLASRSISSNAVNLLGLWSVNKFSHRSLASSGLVLLCCGFLLKINNPCALLEQVSISSSEDKKLSFVQWAPRKCSDARPSGNLHLLPNVGCCVILFTDCVHQLRNVLLLTLACRLNSSINVYKVVKLAESEIGPLVLHIVQTLPLDIHFVIWILLVSKIWIEQESAVVANHRVCVAAA